MATTEQVTKAIQSVQKHIDSIVHQYATTGVPIIHPATQPDYSPLIQAIQARNLLKAETGA